MPWRFRRCACRGTGNRKTNLCQLCRTVRMTRKFVCFWKLPLWLWMVSSSFSLVFVSQRRKSSVDLQQQGCKDAGAVIFSDPVIKEIAENLPCSLRLFHTWDRNDPARGAPMKTLGRRSGTRLMGVCKYHALLLFGRLAQGWPLFIYICSYIFTKRLRRTHASGAPPVATNRPSDRLPPDACQNPGGHGTI